ncbi:MAG: DEAD/DEAH box helicase [Alphaproteobacteria bacterium]|nr:DEAD/DEAH box helicase [Alphaproteobacteria bacterium]
MDFTDLGLGPELLKAIEDIGYTSPTPIQEKAIPIILMARDMIGLAQTGTGKTASFTLPMIEMLASGRARSRMPRSLVLAPTRELAAQVAENFDKYGKYHPLSKALLVGGESMGDQIKILEKGVDVLIATPGRLLDLFDRGQILLTDIRILVIDEADRMLDMGFIPDIETIVSKIPATRQTLLFSATMPDEIKSLSEKFLSNPKTVSVAPPASPAQTVDHRMVSAAPRTKKTQLKKLIESEDIKNAFVFCNRKRDVDSLSKWLCDHGYRAAAMHGDMPQARRTETLQAFKDGGVILLVCSDIAARGLDVSGVSHVFNFDVPLNADDYVHRIGRTGRAGQSGKAWTLVTEDDDKLVAAIRKVTGKDIVVESAMAAEASGRTRARNPAGESNEADVPVKQRARAPSKSSSSSGAHGKAAASSARATAQAITQGAAQPDAASHARRSSNTTSPINNNKKPARHYTDDVFDENTDNYFTDDTVPAFLRK